MAHYSLRGLWPLDPSVDFVFRALQNGMDSDRQPILPFRCLDWSNGPERLISCFNVRINDDCQRFVSYFSCKLSFAPEGEIVKIKNPGKSWINVFCFPPISSSAIIFHCMTIQSLFRSAGKNFFRMFFQISPSSNPLLLLLLLVLMHPSLVTSGRCTSIKLLPLCSHQVFQA